MRTSFKIQCFLYICFFLYILKGNRGSTWVKTVTISAPSSGSKMLQNTYIIAIGRSSSCHESVEKRFSSELKDLRSGLNNVFYSKLHQKYTRVHAELFVSLQDQPEKRQGSFVSMGNSLHTPRWGYCANLSQVASIVPSCNDCYEAMLFNSRPMLTASCHLCDNWRICESSILLAYNPPKHYPFPHNEVRTILPTKLSYEGLADTVSQVHSNIVQRVWTVEQASTYMEVGGLNEKCRTEVIDRATNCLLAISIERQREVEPEVYRILLRDKRTNPQLYKCWPLPSSWCRGVEITQHIDAIMHLVFLGVIKTTMKRVNYWAKVRGKHEAMVSSSKLILEGIQDLRLQWVNVLPYRQGCFSGWVSENYLGMARMLPWFYNNMTNLMGDPVAYKQPTSPQHKWTLTQNKGWLKSRSLSQKGKAKDLSIKVKHFMSLPQYQLPMGPLGGPITDMLFAVRMLWIMTTHLLARTVNADHINNTERTIKLFLSAYARFDKNLRVQSAKSKPGWLTSSNFVCLLNLPRVMHEFGPLPNLWEGGGQGERVLSIIKPTMTGYKRNWQINVVEKILNKMALNRITSSLNDSLFDDEMLEDDVSITSNEVMHIQDDKETLRIHVHYRCYSSLVEVISQTASGKPLSAIHLSDKSFAIVHRASERQQHYLLSIATEMVTVHLGLHYFKFRFLNNGRYASIPLSQPISIDQRACILLPLLRSSENGGYDRYSSDTSCFAVMDSNWQYMEPPNIFKLPNVSRANL